jgi:hypothetical protein
MDGHRLAKARVVQFRYPQIGDKLASRSGQKGTIGMILDPENMPYTKDGIIPDLIVNTYGIPARMTVAQLLDVLNSMLGCQMGFFGLMNPFEPVNPEQIGAMLENIGLDKYCDTTLYNGHTGEMMPSMVFTGPVFYQRLKHMVRDKINARPSGNRIDGITVPGGAYTALTRQTIGGRAAGGGIKIGEMERDVLISHGIFGFMKESLMERCDKYEMYVSRKTGDIVVANPHAEYGDNIYFNSASDGPATYQLTHTVGESNMKTRAEILGLDLSLQKDMDIVKVEVPYALKLLFQEVNGIGISMKIKLKPEGVQFGAKRKHQCGPMDEDVVDADADSDVDVDVDSDDNSGIEMTDEDMMHENELSDIDMETYSDDDGGENDDTETNFKSQFGGASPDSGTPPPPNSKPTGTPPPPNSESTGTPPPPNSESTGTPLPPDSEPTGTPQPPDSEPSGTPLPPNSEPTGTSSSEIQQQSRTPPPLGMLEQDKFGNPGNPGNPKFGNSGNREFGNPVSSGGSNMKTVTISMPVGVSQEGGSPVAATFAQIAALEAGRPTLIQTQTPTPTPTPNINITTQ